MQPRTNDEFMFITNTREASLSKVLECTNNSIGEMIIPSCYHQERDSDRVRIIGQPLYRFPVNVVGRMRESKISAAETKRIGCIVMLFKKTSTGKILFIRCFIINDEGHSTHMMRRLVFCSLELYHSKC